MSEFVPYPRFVPQDDTKGHWDYLRVGEQLSATFYCPNCGTMGMLDEHSIDDEGFVTPSVVCPDECGFHEMIFLEGWHGD